MSLESQTKCEIMFSDTESDYIFSHFFLFSYIPGLYFVYDYMWQLSTYFK